MVCSYNVASTTAWVKNLLNEMDGLGPDARVLFVLTTNRPEVPTCSSPRSPAAPGASTR